MIFKRFKITYFFLVLTLFFSLISCSAKNHTPTENHKANLTDDYQMLRDFYESIRREEFIKNWSLSLESKILTK